AYLAFGTRVVTQSLVRAGLILSSAYLIFTIVGKQLVEHRAHQASSARNVSVQGMFSGTAPLSSLLWRVIAKDGDGYYYEGFVGLLDRLPPSFVRLPLSEALATPLRQSPQHDRLD